MSQKPQHVAIIMDGNGRWARKRMMPRSVGHRWGVKALKQVVGHCLLRKLRYLTVFAFSSENWQRPQDEVGTLMQLFVQSLDDEVAELKQRGVRLHFIGNFEPLHESLRQRIQEAEAMTAANDTLHLTVALNYGGRWDIIQAARRASQLGELTEQSLQAALSSSFAPEPDLLIRTGGEQRISNFLLWQVAYAELYFCDTLWPDFGPEQFDQALHDFAARERRFGRVIETEAAVDNPNPVQI